MMIIVGLNILDNCFVSYFWQCSTNSGYNSLNALMNSIFKF